MVDRGKKWSRVGGNGGKPPKRSLTSNRGEAGSDVFGHTRTAPR